MKDEIISIYAGAADKLRSIDVAHLLGESHVTDDIRQAHARLVAEGTLLKFGRYYSLADSPQHEFPTTSGVRHEKLSTDSGHTAAPSDVSSPDWARPKTTKTPKPLKQEKKTMITSPKPSDQEIVPKKEPAKELSERTIREQQENKVREALERLKQKASRVVTGVKGIHIKIDVLKAIGETDPELFSVCQSMIADLETLDKMRT